VLPHGLNTNQGEDEPNICLNGTALVFQSWNATWREDGGPYYISFMTEKGWTKVKGLGGKISRFFRSPDFTATDGMSISPDMQNMVVASGKDYDGNMDLYFSGIKHNKWTFPKRVSLSTEGDERSPFLSNDGKTLFFASDGYKGYGGLDIFKATMQEDGTWGNITNLGPPFNTAGDDYGLVLPMSGNRAYMVRDGNICEIILPEDHPLLQN